MEETTAPQHNLWIVVRRAALMVVAAIEQEPDWKRDPKLVLARRALRMLARAIE